MLVVFDVLTTHRSNARIELVATSAEDAVTTFTLLEESPVVKYWKCSMKPELFGCAPSNNWPKYKEVFYEHALST